MSAGQRKLSILVASFNGRKHLESCLPAVRAQRDPGCAGSCCCSTTARATGPPAGCASITRGSGWSLARRTSVSPPATTCSPPRPRAMRWSCSTTTPGRSRTGSRRWPMRRAPPLRMSRRSAGGSSTGRGVGSTSATACGPSTATPSSSTSAGRWRRRECRRAARSSPSPAARTCWCGEGPSSRQAASIRVTSPISRTSISAGGCGPVASASWPVAKPWSATFRPPRAIASGRSSAVPCSSATPCSPPTRTSTTSSGRSSRRRFC